MKNLTQKEFNKYYNELVNYYSFKKGINRSQSEEIASIVMSRTISNFDELKNVQFNTFLFNVSNNAIKDYYISLTRQKRQHTLVSINEENQDGGGNVFENTLKDTSLLADEVMEQNDEMNFLLNLLEKLKPIEKQLLILNHVEGLAYKEIVEKTGLEMSYVKTTLRRGKLKLIELAGKK